MQCRMIGYRETMYVEESMLNNSPDRWGLAARLMHGIGVVLIFILVIHGWWMTELATPGGRLNHYTWHASFGYAVLLLTTLRLAWRSQTAAPQPPCVTSCVKNAIAFREVAEDEADVYVLDEHLAVRGPKWEKSRV